VLRAPFRHGGELHKIGVRRVLDKNGEADPTIFPAISDVQLAA